MAKYYGRHYLEYFPISSSCSFSDEVFDLVEDNRPVVPYLEPVFVVIAAIDFPDYFRCKESISLER